MLASGACPLFIQAADVVPDTLYTSLATRGVAGSGWFGGVSLHTTSSTASASGGMPLFADAVASDAASANLNLWAGGGYHSAGGHVDLVVWNTRLDQSSGVALFVAGDGTTAGAYPADNSIGLFIRRRTLAEAVTLFAFQEDEDGPPPEPGPSGGNALATSPLLTVGVGAPAGSLTMYTHGF